MTASAVGSIGIGTTLAGGLLSAFGAERSGEAQQQMYQYQAKVAQINSDIDKQNAAYADKQGEIQAGQYGLKAAQTFGAIRTGEAASGININSGSATDVQRSQRTISNIDQNQIRANAAKVAFDYNTKAAGDQSQATLDILAGNNAKEAGDLAAFSSILGTAGSVSSKWLQGSQIGLWGNKSSSPGPGFVSGL